MTQFIVLGKRFVVFDHDGCSRNKNLYGYPLTEDGSDGYGRPKNTTNVLYIGMMEVSLMPITTLATSPLLEENELWILKGGSPVQRNFGREKDRIFNQFHRW